MRISDRRWNGRAISRRYETTDDPYRPRNHGVFNMIAALVGPQRGPTYQPRAEPVPTGVALGMAVLMN